MCGRYVSASTPDEIAQYFEADEVPEQALPPSWNVAPTDDVYVVVDPGQDGHRSVTAHHWGLVPFWAKDPSVGSRMINTRAEQIASKGQSKHAFRHRRCIVPADGFYEWRKVPGSKVKQPYYLHRADGQPLALAGLWEHWRSPDRPEDELLSTSIITTTPNELVATLHDRMPVILPAAAWERWLSAPDADLDELEALLVPADEDVLVMHAVGTEVGNVRNQGPQLIEPVTPTEELTLDLEGGGAPA